jgi:alkyl sulfatase BDS1-like metallo-beta-lactamase superfamily hydrolase
MADLLADSARILDENLSRGPVLTPKVTPELSEVGEGIALIEAFSHVVAFRTGSGLVLFDTSLEAYGPKVLTALRGWTGDPLNSIAYTHGHVDHVGGTFAFLKEAHETGATRPRLIGHENVGPRFRRYETTNGYNAIINARQFSPSRRVSLNEGGPAAPGRFGPAEFVAPDTIFSDRLDLRVGGLTFELRHAIGETDDHLWAWVPEHRAICAGDFVIWVFPNAGNPQKVQRYPLEWARALREMVALEPELLLPAHGLPVGGRDRIRAMLETMAWSLEELVRQTLDLMNAGARLDDIIHAVKLPREILEKPYMRPLYDEPEFVLHNIWRLYGGWYDGNPSRLKPAPESDLARELVALAGGIEIYLRRAMALADAGDFRLACHLVETAVQAAPDDKAAHAVRRDVYAARAKGESSLMARGIFGSAARESEAKAGPA